MGAIALTDAVTYANGVDLTGYSNSVNLQVEEEEVDATVFSPSGYRTTAGGFKKVTHEQSGLYEAAQDAAVEAMFGASAVMTVAPMSPEGSVAFGFRLRTSKYSRLSGQVGQVAGFTFSGAGSDSFGAVRGRLLKARGNVSATGTAGSTIQVGAVPAGQFLYATFHVFTAGTTIAVQVRSDDASGFASPTTRATIGPLTTVGGTWMTRVAGPITDDWWRLHVNAITGTFEIAGAVFIGA